MNRLFFSRNEKGQLSIFLGISMLIVITFIAFIVNVGLFVKAKINLQNSVDASAWAGAAVQARQLSNIGYVNWEMRNTYKEWMFKYYVLGQLSMNKVNINRPQFASQGSNMSFRRDNFAESGQFFAADTFDKYNSPSLCIAFGSESNICDTYRVPGLPRFQTLGDPGVSEHHEAAINQLVSEKAKDCSKRSLLNASTAFAWVYGTKSNFFPDGVQIATARTGAWIESIELAFRMRNLEMILNRPPVDQPICLDSGRCSDVSALDQEKKELSYNERPIKAFWSGYRNLDNELRASFALTELKPNSQGVEQDTLNSYLIPGQEGLNKPYVDLIPMVINYVMFYHTFSVSTREAGAGGDVGNVDQEGECVGSKTAIPVPAYVLGFYKNPEVLTYYPVKGDAKYIGLFFPFKQFDGIQLTAYAAAKPYGGRVGPMLFKADGTKTVARPSPQNRSTPYISGFLVNGTAYSPGDPIPIDQSFWIQTGSAVGGVPSSAADLGFGVPNLLYDILSDANDQASTNTEYTQYEPAATHAASKNASETTGLHSKVQFKAFADNLAPGSSSQLSVEGTNSSILRARGPTKYEALNYLIPTCHSAVELDSVPVVRPLTGDYQTCIGGSQATSGVDSGVVQYQLFAPFITPDGLYASAAVIQGEVQKILNQNKASINKFLTTIKALAVKIMATNTTRDQGYLDSAQSFYGRIDSSGVATDYNLDGITCDPSDKSMAMQFAQFFGNNGNCPVKPLSNAIEEYISNELTKNPGYATFFTTSYVMRSALAGDPTSLMGAYVPGPLQGATSEGRNLSPLNTGPSQLSRRNFYSTKFIPMKGVVEGGDDPVDEFTIYAETDNIAQTPDGANGGIINKVSTEQLSEFGDELFY